jgi:D-3-phosphoglycerate dehydrogenase / 2-oxoglutarate reductase
MLGTRGELGYVITDVAPFTSPDVVEALEALPQTVRLDVRR